MSSVWLYSLTSVFIISLVSLIGVFTLSVNADRLKKYLLYLIAFAAGALLGDSFLHLLPEVLEKFEAKLYLNVSVLVLLGIIFFFTLEKIIYWRHCHLPITESHRHPVGLINLIGDAFHNFLDGILVAGSFLVNFPLGLATSIAVLLHEIPQEIGDFSILIHAGYTRGRALLFNFLSALLAIAGAAITILVGSTIENFTFYLIPITIGGFIYIAAADLLPEIHREEVTSHSFFQLLLFLLGVAVMALLLLLE